MNWSHQRQICIIVIKCCLGITPVSLIFPRSLSFKIGIVFSCAVICEFCSLVWQTRLVAYRFFRVTSKANLPKSHQMLRGHACKFDFSSFALFQNWYSFLLCSDLWILLLGLTNKTCSLQVFRVIRGKLEWQETIPGPWIIAQNYFCSLTLFSTSPFFRRALVGLCVFSSLDSHILAVTWTPGVL